MIREKLQEFLLQGEELWHEDVLKVILLEDELAATADLKDDPQANFEACHRIAEAYIDLAGVAAQYSILKRLVEGTDH